MQVDEVRWMDHRGVFKALECSIGWVQTYFRMRSSLVTGELLLVRALSFDLEVTLPFTYCLHVLRAMAAVSWFNKAGNEDKRERRRSRSGSPEYHKDIWRHMEQGKMADGSSNL